MWKIWDRSEEVEEEEEEDGHTVRRHERNGDGEKRKGVKII
jgi:hypothetical protein